MSHDYRARIFGQYASGFQDAGATFNPTSARRWGRAYDYYLRGWLPVDKDASIAEVACGDGRLLHFFKDRGYFNLHGLDLSPEQVALARQVIPNVYEGDAREFLEGNAARFSLVVALDLIEHLEKDEALRFLEAANRALTAGGSLILQTPNAGSPWFGEMRYNDFTHEICFNANSLRRILRLTGLTSVEVREAGPIPWGYGLASSMRACGWQCIRTCLNAWNVLETGTRGEAVYTRNFLARAGK